MRGYIAVINKCKRAYQSVRKLKLLSHSALKVKYLGPERKELPTAWLALYTFFFFFKKTDVETTLILRERILG